MKKIILTALTMSLSTAAFALATPEQVELECERQMRLGICTTQTDPAGVSPTATVMISGVGRLPASVYQDYMRLLDKDKPTDPAMCKFALEKLNVNPVSQHSVVARALWEPQERKSLLGAAVAASVVLAAGAMAAAAAFMAARRPGQKGAVA